MDLLLVGEAARKDATTSATQEQCASNFDRWKRFLKQIGIYNDDFLITFNKPWHRTLLLSAFAQAMREASFSSAAYTSLAETTVRTAVDNVAQTFRANNRPDPRTDDDGKLNFILQHQYKGYKNKDKNIKQQKALPLCVIRKLHTIKSTAENIAIAQLCTGAIFFAMRSCEYLRTNIPEEKRRTNTLRLRNIRFFRKGRELKHSDPNLALADTVTVTFEFQKSDERHESITMHRSGDNLLCPVRSWASIVRRILSYPGTNADTTVNTVLINGRLKTITSATVRAKLRSAASIIGKDNLGFEPNDVGTHSIRSGAAMAMYLAHVPTFTIMMIGRWSSDAFLRYICKQVEQFSHNVSSRMIRNESFFTTPDFRPSISNLDTRTPGDPKNFATRFIGGVANPRERFALCV